MKEDRSISPLDNGTLEQWRLQGARGSLFVNNTKQGWAIDRGFVNWSNALDRAIEVFTNTRISFAKYSDAGPDSLIQSEGFSRP